MRGTATSTDTTRTRRVFAVVVAVVGSAVVARLARRRLLRWGATDSEKDAVQPGDGLIADANVTATRAITIRRSPEMVWPWIAQLGQGKGGFYSYDNLENFAGLDIHSADRVVAEWQQIEVGDEVRLAATVALKAAIVEPRRALVLLGALPLAKAPPFDSTWAFILCGQADGSTRLLSRERYGYTRWWAPFVVEPTQAVSFLMSRKMLRGIRDRAERGPLSPSRSTAQDGEVHDVRGR
jgi:hypothetical protein